MTRLHPAQRGGRSACCRISTSDTASRCSGAKRGRSQTRTKRPASELPVPSVCLKHRVTVSGTQITSPPPTIKKKKSERRARSHAVHIHQVYRAPGSLLPGSVNVKKRRLEYSQGQMSKGGLSCYKKNLTPILEDTPRKVNTGNHPVEFVASFLLSCRTAEALCREMLFTHTRQHERLH